jgi:hypothetical protein
MYLLSTVELYHIGRYAIFHRHSRCSARWILLRGLEKEVDGAKRVPWIDGGLSQRATLVEEIRQEHVSNVQAQLLSQPRIRQPNTGSTTRIWCERRMQSLVNVVNPLAKP